MKKNFKKFLSILLSLLMLMSVMSVGVSAEDTTQAVVEETEEEHRYIFEVFIDFWVEIYEFFKYIFYDVFRGEPVA